MRRCGPALRTAVRMGLREIALTWAPGIKPGGDSWRVDSSLLDGAGLMPAAKPQCMPLVFALVACRCIFRHVDSGGRQNAGNDGGSLRKHSIICCNCAISGCLLEQCHQFPT